MSATSLRKWLPVPRSLLGRMLLLTLLVVLLAQALSSLIWVSQLRASQINACAFCIQMHVADALKDGETHLRLHMVACWRESPLFTHTLALCESCWQKTTPCSAKASSTWSSGTPSATNW